MFKNTFKSWNEISCDPNSPEVLEFRAMTLAAARRRQLIPDRAEYLCQLVDGKNALDIGVVEHFSASSERNEWLHGQLCKLASRCLGMDVLEKEVQELCDKGYDVVVCDITKESLSEKFELIIIGDVIEHLGNPSALFENTKKMLMPGGRIVISTPNPWYANAILKNMFEGKPFTDSVDHVTWFDAGTLCELGARNGFRLDRYAGVIEKKSTTVRSVVLFKFAPFLIKLGMRPEFFAKTMVYEFVLPTSG